MKTSSKEANDDKDLLTYQPGCLGTHDSADNQAKFKITLAGMDPENHSKL
jgi:hypothetical protein